MAQRKRPASRLAVVIRLLPVVIGASVLTIAALWLMRRWVDPATFHDSNDVVGNYLQTVGTIYAVLLAFVVRSVWSQCRSVYIYSMSSSARV